MPPSPPEPEWERHGECNRCGFCCAYLGITTVNIKQEQMEPAYAKVRGWEQAGDRFFIRTYMYSPCPQYDDEAKGCGIYEERPNTCRDFPERPGQVLSTPCSYWFRRVVDGKEEIIGGDGSPHAPDLIRWK